MTPSESSGTPASDATTSVAICRDAANQMLAENLQWCLDPNHILVVCAELAALREQVARLTRERDEARAETAAKIYEISVAFRAVNVDAVAKAVGADIFALATRADAAEKREAVLHVERDEALALVEAMRGALVPVFDASEAHRAAVERYNARRIVIDEERSRGDWSGKLDTYFAEITSTERAYFDACRKLRDRRTALSTTPSAALADLTDRIRRERATVPDHEVSAAFDAALEAAGSYAELSRRTGVSDEYVRQVAKGDRPPRGKLLAFLGFEVVRTYRCRATIEALADKGGRSETKPTTWGEWERAMQEREGKP